MKQSITEQSKKHPRNTQAPGRFARRALFVAAIFTLGLPAAQADLRLESPAIVESNPMVGEVSLVLGRAWIESDGKRRKAATPGTVIRATDRILTDANGHVHIRFVDQALVSVRPDSRLEIVQYDYNADQPRLSSIKLNLEEGVTRSISGHGAGSARDRFRLNTPIAAIGVRGTDFVVSASQYSVRALVNEGAIVMAPFSSDCLASAFGPCALNAVELTDSSLHVIEINSNNATPRLLPAALDREADMMHDEVNVAIADHQSSAENKTSGSGVFLENVTSIRVTADVQSSSSPQPSPRPQPAEPPRPLPDLTPQAPVAVAVLSERQLVWGRWSEGRGNDERLTMAYQDARAGRDVTVGNADYVLFREGDYSRVPQDNPGSVSFSLASAQAFYSSDSGVVAMAVNGGSLEINFVTNQFSTQLNMSHSLTGKVDFMASGGLYEGGFFHSRSQTERMAGAVSLDGKEAGYFFEKQLQSGSIQGLTLWDQR